MWMIVNCVSNPPQTNYYLNGVTHGPVHIMIGGAWGETSVFKKVSTIDFLLKGPMIVLLFKILWRMGYTRCPVSCSSTEACRCSIPQKYIDTYGAQGIAINSNISSFLAGYIDMNNSSLVLDVLRGVEDPGIVGDMVLIDWPCRFLLLVGSYTSICCRV